MTGLNAARSWAGKLGESDMTNKLGVQVRYDHVDPLALYQYGAARVRRARYARTT